MGMPSWRCKRFSFARNDIYSIGGVKGELLKGSCTRFNVCILKNSRGKVVETI